jgi:hypothetical protein
MLLEIFCVSIVLFVGLVLYYVTLKNKREKIDFHGKHVLELNDEYDGSS